MDSGSVIDEQFVESGSDRAQGHKKKKGKNKEEAKKDQPPEPKKVITKNSWSSVNPLLFKIRTRFLLSLLLA